MWRWLFEVGQPRSVASHCPGCCVASTILHRRSQPLAAHQEAWQNWKPIWCANDQHHEGLVCNWSGDGALASQRWYAGEDRPNGNKKKPCRCVATWRSLEAFSRITLRQPARLLIVSKTCAWLASRLTAQSSESWSRVWSLWGLLSCLTGWLARTRTVNLSSLTSPKRLPKLLLRGTLVGLGDGWQGQPGSFLRIGLFRGRRWHSGLRHSVRCIQSQTTLWSTLTRRECTWSLYQNGRMKSRGQSMCSV